MNKKVSNLFEENVKNIKLTTYSRALLEMLDCFMAVNFPNREFEVDLTITEKGEKMKKTATKKTKKAVKKVAKKAVKKVAKKASKKMAKASC